MKKKLIFAMMSLALLTPNVKAITVDGLKNYKESHIEVKCVDATKECTLTLNNDAVQDIVISEGEKITLDLGTHNLTNYDSSTSAVSFAENCKNASVTIKGSGTITLKEGTNDGVPVINVAKDNSLIFEGGKVVVNKAKSTGIYNAGTLKVTGGTIETGIAGAWGLTNVGTATISDGTFNQNYDYSVLMNSGEMTIDNGIFTVKNEGTTHYSLITNTKEDAGTNAKLTINDGTFTAAKGAKIVSNGAENATVDVKGGKFDETVADSNVAISKYISATSAVKLNGVMYVGENAKSVATSAKAEDVIEVVKGDYIVEDLAVGVIVKNSGTGTVTINGVEVKTGDEITSAAKVEDNKEENKDNEEKQVTNVENVYYEDNGDGVEIEGNVINEKDETYEAMIKAAEEKGYTEGLKMFEFHIKGEGQLTKPLKLTFDLGTEFNGKLALVIHQKHNGEYEPFERTVTEGKITIEVSELSPFIVLLKDQVVNNEEVNNTSNNPQTSSINVVLYGALSVASLGGLIILINRKKKGAN